MTQTIRVALTELIMGIGRLINQALGSIITLVLSLPLFKTVPLTIPAKIQVILHRHKNSQNQRPPISIFSVSNKTNILTTESSRWVQRRLVALFCSRNLVISFRVPRLSRQGLATSRNLLRSRAGFHDL